MPRTTGQGQSRDATEFKERGIAAALKVNLSIFQNKFGGKSYATYQHFDLNCGCGINKEANCIGSPLAYMQEVKLIRPKHRAHFVDINGEATSLLLKHQEMNDPNCFVHHGDNLEFVVAIPGLVDLTDNPKKAIGTVLCDPNGTQIPVKQLSWLANECPKLDIMLNVNATAFKRCQNNSVVSSKGTIEDILYEINKEHWLIREPIGSHQWTMLIGRNVRVNDHNAMGFHHLNSSTGRDAFNRANLTADKYLERSGQLALL